MEKTNKVEIRLSSGLVLSFEKGTYTEITRDELVAEAERRYGKNRMNWKFRCPNCGTVISGLMMDIAKALNAFGQDCIGRYDDALGCKWSTTGLFTAKGTLIVHEGDQIFRWQPFPQEMSK